MNTKKTTTRTEEQRRTKPKKGISSTCGGVGGGGGSWPVQIDLCRFICVSKQKSYLSRYKYDILAGGLMEI